MHCEVFRQQKDRSIPSRHMDYLVQAWHACCLTLLTKNVVKSGGIQKPMKICNQQLNEHGTEMFVSKARPGKMNLSIIHTQDCGLVKYIDFTQNVVICSCGLHQRQSDLLSTLSLIWIPAKKCHLLGDDSHFPSLLLVFSLELQLHYKTNFLAYHLICNIIRFMHTFCLFSPIQISQASEAFGYKLAYLLTSKFHFVPAKIGLHFD